MEKPDQYPKKQLKVAEDASETPPPSFEDLLLQVFSGPMCFECLGESEREETKTEISDDQPI